MLAAEPQLGRGEQPIDDHVVALDAVVDELGAAFRADDPERRHLALADAARELDEHLPPVVEGAQRPPGGIVALDRGSGSSARRYRRRSATGAAASAAAFCRRSAIS